MLLLQPKCITGLEGRWLGATDITTEGNFIWESGRPLTYHNWSQPGPDNSEGIENCAVMYCNYGQWNDLNCVNNHVNTLCEINFPCTSGLRTPAYLHIPHFEDCLGKKKVESAQFWCLPAAKPDHCLAASWQQLVADGELSNCPLIS